jgi:hypothetical protein
LGQIRERPSAVLNHFAHQGFANSVGCPSDFRTFGHV